MLKSKRMSKALIIGPSSNLRKTVDELHRLKIYHILDHKKGNVDIGEPLDTAEEISRVLINLNSLLATLENEITDKAFEMEFSEILEKIENIHGQISSINSEIRKNSEITTTNHELIDIIEKLNLLKLEIEDVKHYDSLRIFIGKIESNNLEQFKNEVLDAGNHPIFKSNQLDNSVLFAIITDQVFESKISNIIGKFNARLNDLTCLDGVKGKNQKNLDILKYDLGIARASSSNLEFQKKDLIERESSFLNYAKNILDQEYEIAVAPLRFGSTTNVFIIEGFLPRKDFNKTKLSLEKITSGEIYIKEQEITKSESIPIELQNKGKIKNFEFFLDLYALPKYNEIDPTFFIFISFPLLFGFMLGDMGYGITTLILFLILKKKFTRANRFFNVLIFSALATIFFGALFGEFFGEEIIMGYHLPNIISRAHQIETLLYISLAIGIIQINFGLLLGFINEFKSHGFFTAVYEKLGWVVLEVSAVLFYLAYSVESIAAWAAWAIMIVAVIMIIVGEGVKGIIELPSIFSNILSYARLMAIGLASVQVAMVVNDFAFPLFRSGILGIIGGILLLAVGHTINILLGLIGPFLHSLRLHYVEFFTKFYSGGGIPFTPFGRKN